MFDAIVRTASAAWGAVRRFTREREPVVVANAVAATAVAAVTEWQGELTGQAAWVAVLWGAGVFVARMLATPAAKPPPTV
jgi:hypothetical protein